MNKIEQLSLTDYGNLTPELLGFRTITGVNHDPVSTAITLTLSDATTIPLGAVLPPAAKNIVNVFLDGSSHIIFEMDFGPNIDGGLLAGGGGWQLPTYTGTKGLLTTRNGNVFKPLVSTSGELVFTETPTDLTIDLNMPEAGVETFLDRITIVTEEKTGTLYSTPNALTAVTITTEYLRPMTTLGINNLGITLDAGKMIVPAGLYRVVGNISGNRQHTSVLRNAITLQNLIVAPTLSGYTLSHAQLTGFIKLTETTTLEIIWKNHTNSSDGSAAGNGLVVDPVKLNAVFSKILFHKVADYVAPPEPEVHPIEPHLYSGYWYTDMRFVGTASTLGGSWVPGTDKWQGSVLGPNGKIYCAPKAGGKVLVIDTATNTSSVTDFGLTLTGEWGGGCLAGDGKIYMVPRTGTTTGVLVIDPVANTAVINNFSLTFTGTDLYYGAVMGGDGKIYGIPHNATGVLVIDPATSTASVTDFTLTMTGSAKWSTGCLGLDGKIYCMPVSSGTVLVIDPTTNTATTVPAGTTGQFESSCLGSDGKIYAAASNVAELLVIDTKLNELTVKVIPGTFTGAKYYVGGCLGSDGLLYFTPHDQQSILRYDPFKQTFEHVTYGVTMSGTAKWAGVTVAENGVMYFIPDSSDEGILTVTSLLHCTGWEPRLLMSPYLNKF